MRIKDLFISAVAFLGLFLVMWVPTTNASELETQALIKELAKQVQYFDGDGNPIYPYTLEEIEKSFIIEGELENQLITPMADSQYNSGAFFFYNYMWIFNSNKFYNIKSTQTTPDGVAAAHIVEVHYAKTGVAGSVWYPDGWTGPIHTTWTHLPRGQSYMVKYTNLDGLSSIVKIKNAGVTYE